MMKKSFVIASLTGVVFCNSLGAVTLQENVKEVLNTNPVVQERLKNFRATQQDLNIAESEYYPQLDLSASAGYNNGGELYSHVRDPDYTNYNSTLTLTQNLFDGFSTMHKVDYEEARILSAAYHYIEKANDMAFEMTSAYVSVLRSYELLQTARENVQINETIYFKVKDLFDAGLTTDSEVKKIQSTLSLARSNLTVQQNNARDTEYTYRRVLGRMPSVSEMKRPDFDLPMPESIERAAMYSIEHNPSLLVSQYNIKGAQALWKQREKDYYPKFDLEVSQSYNDASRVPNGFDQADDRFKARILMTYNLYRGGADKANIQKHVSKINQEIEIKRDLKRQVIEGLDLSWNAYEMIGLQLQDLKKYSDYSEKTLNLYKEEYDLGRRSLLDLLSAQTDVINSRSQIIKSEYDRLFAKYRILDAMGLLVTAVAGQENDYTAKVNLYTDEDAHEILDTLPVKLDVDGDNIVDNLDLCDNSLKENNIMPYGCKEFKRDNDGDGVYNSVDQCPLTPRGVKVDAKGCAYDTDMDGIMDYLDKCPDTPQGYRVNNKGCTSSLNLGVNFLYYSYEVDEDSKERVKEFANFIKTKPNAKILIVGHTSSKGDADLNMKLSKNRANAIYEMLIEDGVPAEIMSTEGRGENEPIADNSTPEGKHTNRRVEVELVEE